MKEVTTKELLRDIYRLIDNYEQTGREAVYNYLQLKIDYLKAKAKELRYDKSI